MISSVFCVSVAEDTLDGGSETILNQQVFLLAIKAILIG